jgi:hypothetical protein
VLSLSLPDDVRAALRDEGISEDEMLLMTGDELVERVGPMIVYELAVALTAQGCTIASYSGRRNRLPAEHLRERNLMILRLRLVERMTFTEVGREVRVSRSRVDQVLKGHFGVRKRTRNVITVPATALDALRDALTELLTGRIEDMATEARGPAFGRTLAEFDRVRSLLADVGWEPRDPEADVDLHLGRGRDRALVQALRDSLATQRHLADTHDDAQRERAERAATAVALLLAMVER